MGGGAKGRTQSKGSTATTTDIAVDRNLHIVLCRDRASWLHACTQDSGSQKSSAFYECRLAKN